MKNNKLVGILPVLLLSLTAFMNNASATLINGSFETGDYTGWTLTKDVLIRSDATWGIGTDGTTLNVVDLFFDHTDSADYEQFSVGLPYTFEASDGNFVAANYQNGPSTSTMSQVFTLGLFSELLTWDMFYWSHDPIDTVEQSLFITLTDLTDNTEYSLFQTSTGDPTTNGAMTSYLAHIGGFSGKDVKLSVTTNVQNFFFDAVFDNFEITTVPVPAPSALAFFALGLIGLASRRIKKQS